MSLTHITRPSRGDLHATEELLPPSDRSPRVNDVVTSRDVELIVERGDEAAVVWDNAQSSAYRDLSEVNIRADLHLAVLLREPNELKLG